VQIDATRRPRPWLIALRYVSKGLRRKVSELGRIARGRNILNRDSRNEGGLAKA
jgi:hypothetical protein